jgi:hypothetical protein
VAVEQPVDSACLDDLRVVRGEGSATGWKIEVGPFPGWETVPTW